jgi:hypothetical protein
MSSERSTKTLLNSHPRAQRVLEDLSTVFLKSTGRLSAHPPERMAEGGLLGSWKLAWPLLDAAEANNRTNSLSLEAGNAWSWSNSYT